MAVWSSTTPMSPDPVELGYRMPAEWEPHEATWMTWPSHPLLGPPKTLLQLEHLFLEMIEALLDAEIVRLVVPPGRAAEVVDKIRRAGINTSRLVTYEARTADIWIRDYGPIFIKGTNSKAWCKWEFNAWGRKYEDHLQDNEVFLALKKNIPFPCYQVPFVLEGGAIEVNGEGLALVTEESLLHRNRGEERSKPKVEDYLWRFLGIEHCVWLGQGLAGDDTDGHIDQVARFVTPQTVVVVQEKDPWAINHSRLQENWERLSVTSERKGRPLKLIPLPLPRRFQKNKTVLPASYANFYIANKVVFLPTFADPEDKRALGILRELFPNRIIVGIDAQTLILHGGAIHCLTQQEPAPGTGSGLAI